MMLLRIFFFFSSLFCPVNTLTQKKEGKKYIIEVSIGIISFHSQSCKNLIVSSADLLKE